MAKQRYDSIYSTVSDKSKEQVYVTKGLCECYKENPLSQSETRHILIICSCIIVSVVCFVNLIQFVALLHLKGEVDNLKSSKHCMCACTNDCMKTNEQSVYNTQDTKQNDLIYETKKEDHHNVIQQGQSRNKLNITTVKQNSSEDKSFYQPHVDGMSRVKREDAKKKKSNKKSKRSRSRFQPIPVAFSSNKPSNDYAPVKTLQDKWKMNFKVKKAEADGGTYVIMDTGSITLKQTGVYLIYSQITYRTQYFRVNYGIYTGKGDENDLCISQCFSGSNRGNERYSDSLRVLSCFTARIIHMEAETQVYLKDYTSHTGENINHTIFLRPELTNWGMFRLQ